jgi:hypothetical protein
MMVDMTFDKEKTVLRYKKKEFFEHDGEYILKRLKEKGLETKINTRYVYIFLPFNPFERSNKDIKNKA